MMPPTVAAAPAWRIGGCSRLALAANPCRHVRGRVLALMPRISSAWDDAGVELRAVAAAAAGLAAGFVSAADHPGSARRLVRRPVRGRRSGHPRGGRAAARASGWSRGTAHLSAATGRCSSWRRSRGSSREWRNPRHRLGAGVHDRPRAARLLPTGGGAGRAGLSRSARRTSRLERVALATAYAGAILGLGLVPALALDTVEQSCARCPGQLGCGRGPRAGSSPTAGAVGQRLGCRLGDSARDRAAVATRPHHGAGTAGRRPGARGRPRATNASSPRRSPSSPSVVARPIVAAGSAAAARPGCGPQRRWRWASPGSGCGCDGRARRWRRWSSTSASHRRRAGCATRWPRRWATPGSGRGLSRSATVAWWTRTDGRSSDPDRRRAGRHGAGARRPRGRPDPAPARPSGAPGPRRARSPRPRAWAWRTSACRPRHAPSSRTCRASRARIVQTGDAERRRLERDLHDGAQQRLVGLALGIGLHRSPARRRTATPRRWPGWTRPRPSCAPRSTSCASSPTGCTRRSSSDHGLGGGASRPWRRAARRRCAVVEVPPQRLRRRRKRSPTRWSAAAAPDRSGARARRARGRPARRRRRGGAPARPPGRPRGPGRRPRRDAGGRGPDRRGRAPAGRRSRARRDRGRLRAAARGPRAPAGRGRLRGRGHRRGRRGAALARSARVAARRRGRRHPHAADVHRRGHPAAMRIRQAHRRRRRPRAVAAPGLAVRAAAAPGGARGRGLPAEGARVGGRRARRRAGSGSPRASA